MGGTLDQEVTKAGTIHEPITADSDPEEVKSRRHVVRFEKRSVIGEIYGADEAKVNTLHHQGLARVAEGLIVEGRSDDGLIEAARFDGDWWALGIQWHPERMEGNHQAIFEAFKEAIEQNRHT